MANSAVAAAKKETRQYWTVGVIDSAGIRSIKNLTADKGWVLDNHKIVLPFRGSQPKGEVSGLLGRILGNLVKDCTLFPIGFDSWPLVPQSYKDRAWNDVIKPRLWIEEEQMDIARHYILQDLGVKWRNNRVHLWNDEYKVDKTREENIEARPSHVPLEQWAMFIDYRLRPSTQKMCKINAINKQKHVTPHTGGSKKNSIKKDEMEQTLGREVSRGEVYISTHVKPNGAYSSAESEVICEKISAIEETGEVPATVKRTDSLGQVLGPEHPGRVRILGSGVAPTQVFGSSSLFHGNYSSSSSNSASYISQEEKYKKVEAELHEERSKRRKIEAVLAHIVNHMGVTLPPELAFPDQPSEHDEADQNHLSSQSSTRDAN